MFNQADMSSLVVYITCGRTASNEQKGIEIRGKKSPDEKNLLLLLFFRHNYLILIEFFLTFYSIKNKKSDSLHICFK